MSDQKQPPDLPVKDAVPAPEGGDGGKLPPRQTSWSQQIFIWTMIVLVGIVFGVGPSFGLAFQRRDLVSSYQVDPLQVEHRMRIG